MSTLAQTIPGLNRHRTQVRGPQYDYHQAKQSIDRVLFWMKDEIPEDLLAWMVDHEPEQHQRLMTAWREIDVCDKNRDLEGVRSCCSAMIAAMQRGLRSYNSTPEPVVEVDTQGALF